MLLVTPSSPSSSLTLGTPLTASLAHLSSPHASSHSPCSPASKTTPRCDLKELPSDRRALFETTRRLIASLVNEGLVHATYDTASHSLLLGPVMTTPSTATGPANPHKQRCRPNTAITALMVPLRLDAGQPLFSDTNQSEEVVVVVDPDDFAAPVYVVYGELRRGGDDADDDGRTVRFDAEGAHGHNEATELRPGVLFRHALSWQTDEYDVAAADRIVEELESSAANQEFLFRYHAEHTPNPPELTSPAIVWEQAVITGHPTHPMHKSCVADAPLEPVEPSDMPSLLHPTISFVSLPRADLRICGPLEALIRPLIPHRTDSEGHITVPALTRQLPAILARFPEACVVTSTEGNQKKPFIIRADAQASVRTVKPLSEAEADPFPYHIKLPLACRITSALRTVTPWTTAIGPELTDKIMDLFPETMWLAREFASFSGAQEDFGEAKHLAGVIREDPEIKALELGETVIVTAALVERPAVESVQGSTIHAQRVFKLNTDDEKADWLRRYAQLLLGSAIPLLRDYGIGLEAHGQNLLVRVDRRTGALRGFVVRDCGGLKIHTPTFTAKTGRTLDTLPGSLVVTDDFDESCTLLFHTVVQNHLHRLVRGLQLGSRGWSVIREVLNEVCPPSDSNDRIGAFFRMKKVPMKCFIRMKLEGLYRDYIHRDISNVLFS